MSRLLGRRGELRALRERLDAPGPSLTLLTGPRRAGAAELVRAALAEAPARDVLWYRAGPLAEADHRALLAGRIETFMGEGAGGGDSETVSGPPPEAGWSELLGTLTRHLYTTHRRSVVVLDGWHRLVDAHARIYRPFTEFWLGVRRRGVPLHLVLSTRPDAPLEPFRDGEDPLSGWLDEELRLGPLPYREVANLLPPSRDPAERLLAYAVFGGWPEAAARLDPARSLEENAVQEILGPDAPLRDWGIQLLDRTMQAPGRYASLLRALAGGARTWSELRGALAGFGSSGQLAPYLRRLDDLGLVEVRRSLDASPGSRSRRYRIVDPLAVFWFRFVLPHLSELETGRHEEVWREVVRPRLDEHMSLLFPAICRDWLTLYGDERLPARGREVGALWGPDYDLEAAGILEDGGLVRGTARWLGAGEAAVDEIAEQAERTRYGFGRRRRHTVAFTGRDPPAPLVRRAAAEQGVHVVGPEDLLGAGAARSRADGTSPGS